MKNKPSSDVMQEKVPFTLADGRKVTLTKETIFHLMSANTLKTQGQTEDERQIGRDLVDVMGRAVSIQAHLAEQGIPYEGVQKLNRIAGTLFGTDELGKKYDSQN